MYLFIYCRKEPPATVGNDGDESGRPEPNCKVAGCKTIGRAAAFKLDVVILFLLVI